MAREWLTEYGYPESSICAVERLIYVTIPFTPAETLAEKIIQDADLDNFGRKDCFEKMYRVENELRSIAQLDTKTIYTIFLSLHEKYHFQTTTSIRERQEKKEENAREFRKIYENVINSLQNEKL